jgi:hypothetical protein
MSGTPKTTTFLKAVAIIPLLIGATYLVHQLSVSTVTYESDTYVAAVASTSISSTSESSVTKAAPIWPLPLDTTDYDSRLLALANITLPRTLVATTATNSAAANVPTPVYSSTTNVTIAGKSWPAAAVYPHGGAILPFKRILAYYGNFYSRQMGILGEYEPEEVLRRLNATKALWE